MTNRIIRFVPVALLFALCSVVEVQQPEKVFRIGYLDPSSASATGGLLEAFAARAEQTRLD